MLILFRIQVRRSSCTSSRTLKIVYQHNRYFLSAARKSKPQERTLYRTSGLRVNKVYVKKAMTSRKDNDTSVWSKVEREQTVATYEGSSGRSSEW